MHELVVTAARPEEEAACLALLPEVAGMAVELLAARQDGRIVGAAALVWESWQTPAGFPLAVHVMPGARRQGVGAALVAAALVLIDGETDGLWSLGNLPEDSEAARFLQAQGFSAGKRILHFSIDTVAFDHHMTRIVDRLRRNNRIPATARAVPLRDAPLDAVARLVSTEFGNGPTRLLQRLRMGIDSGAGGLDFDRSTVVIEDDRLVGVLLSRWDGPDPAIEANVVAPAWRNSYVNALQLQTSTRRGLEAGSTRFLFDCDETVRNSMNLALRGGGEQLATEARFYRAATA